MLDYTVLVLIAVSSRSSMLRLPCFRWAQGLRSFVINAGRLTLPVSAYGRHLADTYPSFTLSPQTGQRCQRCDVPTEACLPIWQV